LRAHGCHRARPVARPAAKLASRRHPLAIPHEFPLSEFPTPVAAAPPARRGLTPLDFALYATVVLLWGLSWGALRYQVGVVAPEISGLWRFAMAAPAMLLIGALRGERFAYGLANHGRFLLLGATMFCINFVVVYYAAYYVTTGLIATSFSLAALVNVATGALILRAPVDRRVVIGGVFGVTGVALMFYPEVFGARLGSGALIGFALSMICTVSFSLGNVVSVEVQRRHIPVFVASGYGMLYGCALLAGFAALRGLPFIIEWTVSYVLSLVYLGLFASVIAFACYFTLLNRIGADRAGYVTVLMPVVALTASTFAEGYVWTLPAAIGIVAVMIGNVLVLRTPKRS
jgi:drug/metabolite transporter (DMT)-like permease